RRHAGQGAVVTQHDAAQVIVVADAAEYDLCAACRFAGCGRRLAAELGLPGLGLGCGTVVDGDVVPGPGKVAGHWKAHDNQAQKGNTMWRLGFVVEYIYAYHYVSILVFV